MEQLGKASGARMSVARPSEERLGKAGVAPLDWFRAVRGGKAGWAWHSMVERSPVWPGMVRHGATTRGHGMSERKKRTMRVKGAGPMVPGLRDPIDGYGEEIPEERFLLLWTNLPIPMAVAPDGRIVVTSPAPPGSKGPGHEGFARFPTQEAAQAAIDGDPSLRAGECVIVSLAAYDASLQRRERKPRQPVDPEEGA